MEQSLVAFALRLNILEKHYLEEVSFQEDVDDAWTHLNNSQIEEENRPQKRQVHEVVNVCEGIVLFVGERFDEIVVYFLFESPDVFGVMLKEFGEVRVISSFPFRLPADFQSLVLANKVPMDILEVEDISSIFRDILYVTVDVMNGLTPVAVILAELFSVYHLEVGFNLWIRVDPNVNKSVKLFCMIFS